MSARLAAAALCALLALQCRVLAFYLPGVAPQDYEKVRVDQRRLSNEPTGQQRQAEHALECAGSAHPIPQDEQTQLLQDAVAISVLLSAVLPASTHHLLSREFGGGFERGQNRQLEVPGVLLVLPS